MIQLLMAIGLGTIAFVLLSRWKKDKDQQDRLERSFYQLIKIKGGSLSLIQLATMAQVDAALAKEYFDRQVRVLNAIPEVDDDGDLTYRFPKLDLPRALPDDDWGSSNQDDGWS